MPYAPRLIRCNLNAVTAGGEQVVNSIWMQGDAFDVVDPLSLQAVADRVRDRWSDAILTGSGGALAMAGFFHGATRWESVTAYAVNNLGRSVAQAESSFAANVLGSAGSALPAQVALAVTLLTGVPGRSGRGRVFLGGLASTGVDPSGRVSIERRDAIARGMAQFYIGLRDSTGQPDVVRPVVVSPTLGTARKITAVQVGDVFDTMRSRRKSLDEARFRVAVDE